MKNVSGFILATFFMIIMAGQVVAQSETSTGQQEAKQVTTASDYGKFTDKNGDGVCDNFEARGEKAGKGCNFVDANGDGICDHRADGTCLKGNANCCKGQGTNCGKGKGYQHRNGSGGPCGKGQAPDKK